MKKKFLGILLTGLVAFVPIIGLATKTYSAETDAYVEIKDNGEVIIYNEPEVRLQYPNMEGNGVERLTNEHETTDKNLDILQDLEHVVRNEYNEYKNKTITTFEEYMHKQRLQEGFDKLGIKANNAILSENYLHIKLSLLKQIKEDIATQIANKGYYNAKESFRDSDSFNELLNIQYEERKNTASSLFPRLVECDDNANTALDEEIQYKKQLYEIEEQLKIETDENIIEELLNKQNEINQQYNTIAHKVAVYDMDFAVLDKDFGMRYSRLIELYDEIYLFLREYATRNIEVNKTVQNTSNNSQEFTFEITLSDDMGKEEVNLEGSYRDGLSDWSDLEYLTYNASITKTTAVGSMDTDTLKFSDGKATFTLKANEKVNIDIPAIYGYTIKEIVPSGYTSSVNNQDVNIYTHNGATTVTDIDPYNTEYKDKIDFSNTYSAKGNISFEGTKVLNGKSMESFSFVLKENEEIIDETTNDEEGKISFKNIEYTLDDVGTHAYTIAEVNDNKDNIVYDTHKERIFVEISDNGDGTLKVSPVYDKDGIVFTNEYEEPTTAEEETTTEEETITTTESESTTQETTTEEESDTVTEEKSESSEVSEKEIDLVESNPDTGDNSNIGLWVGLAGLSAIIATTGLIFRKKKD